MGLLSTLSFGHASLNFLRNPLREYLRFLVLFLDKEGAAGADPGGVDRRCKTSGLPMPKASAPNQRGLGIKKRNNVLTILFRDSYTVS